MNKLSIIKDGNDEKEIELGEVTDLKMEFKSGGLLDGPTASNYFDDGEWSARKESLERDIVNALGVNINSCFSDWRDTQPPDIKRHKVIEGVGHIVQDEEQVETTQRERLKYLEARSLSLSSLELLEMKCLQIKLGYVGRNTIEGEIVKKPKLLGE